MKKLTYTLATVVVFGFPFALQQNWISAEWFGLATTVYIVSAALIVIFEVASRRDYRDQVEVMTRGMSGVDSALQDLVSAGRGGRTSLFEKLYMTATGSIVGLANPIYVQAQFFRIYEHDDHKHFVSEYTNEGSEKKSQNHFSSVGDDVDKLVWEKALARETRIERNLAWHKFGKMPIGFKRRERKRYNAFITSPVFANDVLIGLLTINSKVPYSLSRADALIVEAIARKIGIGASCSSSLQNYKSYANIKSSGKKGCRP